MTTTRRIDSVGARIGIVLIVLTAAACGSKKPPVARPTPPPPQNSASASTAPARPPAAPRPVAEATVVPSEPVVPNESISSATSSSLDDLNRTSPLAPVFYELDSAEVSPEGQKVLDANATLMRQNASWVVTIEGHCDERGTAEYNLALGERRALAARAYLVSLGLSAERLRTVSYGKEFPFDPGRDESAFSRNRRAHFVITAK